MMRASRPVLIAAALVGLTGCTKMEATDNGGAHHGRYAGIGLFSPGKIWAHLQGDVTKDPAAAKPEDDDVLIIVVDSDTGEVRECGNYSGRCVSMNPWTKAVGPQLHMPVRVSAHAAELANEGTTENVTTSDLDNSSTDMAPAKPSPAKAH
jgi:hypothetical protein